MPRPPEKAKKWVAKLKEKGITRFKFRELPRELKSKGNLHKAADLKLIDKAEKDKNNVATWMVQ